MGDWYATQTVSPGRFFAGTRRVIEDGRNTEVLIDGTQNSDGSTARFVSLIEGGCERICELTAEQARAIGVALIAAAAEARRLAYN